MKQTPDIKMKCPKCSGEYPASASYCEACSVMLEPVEIGEESAPEPEKSGPRPPGAASTQGEERLEDVKIDTLKADIETRFVSTLFRERDQLRRKLAKKENKEEIEEITGKIARLEAILLNLGKKIEADIFDLSSRINVMKKPGFFRFMSGDGRYYKMLSSELRTKNILMDVISGRKSRTYFELMGLRKALVLISLSVIFSFIVSWYYFTGSFQEKTAARQDIAGKDVTALLDDIKKANLNKDLALWESRYSRVYLESGGKRENQVELWKKFDFRSLKYRVDDLKIEGGRAGAVITWDMELSAKQENEAKIVSQSLLADFIMDGGRLKINSVTKKED